MPPSANEHGLNITKQTTGILFFPSRWQCHAICLGMWPQNVLFSLPRPQRSASVLITGRKESAALLLCVKKIRFDLILTDLSVRFLITQGTDVTARVTFFSVARRPFAVGDEGATSKCDLTSCKATGHLPCIFIEWSGRGQLAVLRGNTINYTPRCSGWERLTARRSNWKRNIRNGGKHKLWRRREKGEEEK